MLNQQAILRDLQAVHAERYRLRDIEIAQLEEQNKDAANVPQPRQTRFDSRFDSHGPTHHHQRASTAPPAHATNLSKELLSYFNGSDQTGTAAFGNLHSAPAPMRTPGPIWSTVPVTPQTNMPNQGISRKRVPYGRDDPVIESYVTPCPRDPFGKVFHPGDPKDQKNVSTEANTRHWIAFFELSAEEHFSIYVDSEDPEWVRLVLTMVKNRSADKWHYNSIYLIEILKQWIEARILQRTKGKSKDSTTALHTIESLKFPADLRAGDDTKKMAEGWETF